jgi:hypothetical protein
MEFRVRDMNRRAVLQTVAASSVATLTGCMAFGDDGGKRITVSAVDILNRRETSVTAEFVAERNGDIELRRSVSVDGTENSSQPPASEITEFADDPGQYRFRLDVEGGDTLVTTPEELNIENTGTGCLRIVFVVNLDDRLTAYARNPCVDE